MSRLVPRRTLCRCTLILAIVLLLPALATSLPAQQNRAPRSLPAARTYKGRPIARVMSWRGWRWLLRPDRDLWEQPERVLDALRIRPGQIVADIGTGVGYFAVRMAQRVGPTGKVFAVDIQPEMIRMLQQRLTEFGVTNVVPVLSEPDDPKLPPSSIDLALMVDVYHEIQDPDVFMPRLAKALRPTGRLALIEYRAEDPTVPILPDHKMTLRQVRYELEDFGFRLSELHEFLPRQHLIVFRKNTGHDPERFPVVYLPVSQTANAASWRAAGFAAHPVGEPVRCVGYMRIELELLAALPGPGTLRCVGLAGEKAAWTVELRPPSLKLVAADGQLLRDYSQETRWIAWHKATTTWRLTLRYEDGAVRLALDGYPLGAVPVAVPEADSLTIDPGKGVRLTAVWLQTLPFDRRSNKGRPR